MNRQITFRQYRAMDLFFLTALLCLCESLIVLGATRWFPSQPYTLSLAPAVAALVMMRWGVFAFVPALAGGAAFCLVSRATGGQWLIYCLGNLASLAMTAFVRRLTWQRVKENVLLTMLHGFLTALLMQLGRALIALVLGAAPMVCLGFMTTDVLSTLFAVLVMWICRRLDGMLEYQPHYLKRVQEEKEKEARRN